MSLSAQQGKPRVKNGAERVYTLHGGVASYDADRHLYVAHRAERPPVIGAGECSEEEDYYFKTFAPSRRVSFRKGIQRIKQRRGARPTNLLDVGTAYGLFLEIAAREGWTLTGIEPSEALAARARSRAGATVLAADLECIVTTQQWDVITLWDVVEHFAEPERALRIVRGLLRHDGTVLIRVPNAKGVIHRLAFLAHRVSGGRLSFPVEKVFENHYHIFEPVAIRELLAVSGFRVVDQYQERLMSPWVCGKKRYLSGSCVVGRWLVAVALAAVLAVGAVLGAQDSLVVLAEPR